MLMNWHCNFKNFFIIHKFKTSQMLTTTDFYSENSIIKRDYFGYYHCNNGPAVISKNRKEWFQHGKRHCEDGPAIIESIHHWLYGDISVHMEWYHDDKKLPCNTQDEYIAYMQLKSFW